jgi:rhodanese-related sulfurtransferase
MRRLSIFVAAALLIASPLMPVFAAESAAPKGDPLYTYKTTRLDRAHFDALLAKPEKLLIVDVRRPNEITATGGFPVYFSVQTDDVEKSLAFIPKDREIVTVSIRAHRAGKVGDLLTAHGFKVAGAIGVKDYEDEGGTLTKIAPPPPKAADTANH